MNGMSEDLRLVAITSAIEAYNLEEQYWYVGFNKHRWDDIWQ
jgi:hypothetical protein